MTNLIFTLLHILIRVRPTFFIQVIISQSVAFKAILVIIAGLRMVNENTIKHNLKNK